MDEGHLFPILDEVSSHLRRRPLENILKNVPSISRFEGEIRQHMSECICFVIKHASLNVVVIVFCNPFGMLHNRGY